MVDPESVSAAPNMLPLSCQHLIRTYQGHDGRLIPDSYPYSPGGLIAMLEHIVTHSKMLDLIKLVNGDVIR